jgi:hypothetical protein
VRIIEPGGRSPPEKKADRSVGFFRLQRKRGPVTSSLRASVRPELRFQMLHLLPRVRAQEQAPRRAQARQVGGLFLSRRRP